ncbi:glycosyltransferase family 25 protein [Helicobacter cetorum]|uniref:glycosyltransferase family 25 protein n=1 Tax=Helicobacter cetorum TaxID=138563 RepID=UPI000CF14283|nr:glycosyltransferase family 25 protein [Helicobacter cetorum]
MTQVYIISLKDSKRRLDTEELVSQANIDFEGHCAFHIFDAISPKHKDFEELVREFYEPKSLLKSDWFHSDCCNGGLLPQELGCFLSHYFLWKKCLELNEPIIILEDDVALEPNFIQALKDCLKSPFEFVRFCGDYWGYHHTYLNALPIYDNGITPPPPNEESQPIQGSFLAHMVHRVLYFIIYKIFNRIFHLSLYSIVYRFSRIIKNLQRSHYKKYEKETFFLEHFYLTSVYVGRTAGYYLTPKGAKAFVDATRNFKMIEPVDMFMDNPAYTDIASITYIPCALSLNEHSLNSTIANQKPELLKSYALPKAPKKSYFKNLFYYALNARKRQKAFKKFYEKYAYLKSCKDF